MSVTNPTPNVEATRPIRILFVCLGNICRSPSAEGVFRHYVSEQGACDRYDIDSAGLIAHHEGELPDGRMRAHAARRGYELTSRSRPITYEDFFHYDYIIGMDSVNRERLLDLAPTAETAQKVSLLTDWADDAPKDHIPDPYYGGAEGFEHVLDLIELCVPQLYRKTIS
nr:low molecular weight protein-tyrosine-phosphatase [uncultured Porphyromonas sp.]